MENKKYNQIVENKLQELSKNSKLILEVFGGNDNLHSVSVRIAKKIKKSLDFYEPSDERREELLKKEALLKLISGFLFEEIITEQIKQKKIKEVEHEINEISEELLSVWNSHTEYGIELSTLLPRIPDLAFISVNENENHSLVVTVESAGEAKLSALDPRAKEQLDTNKGFLPYLKELVQQINNLSYEELKKRGLHKLAEAIKSGKKLEVNNEFITYLFFPANLNTPNKQFNRALNYKIAEDLINSKRFKDLYDKNAYAEIKEFINLLLSNDIKTVNVDFQRSDIYEIAELIFSNIFENKAN